MTHLSEPSCQNPIEISVVVPVRNEEDSVRALLEGLLNQTLPPKEILITDGGSADATTKIIEEFIDNGAPVKLFRENESKPGRSRNVGVMNSQCEWLAFIDAGTTPAPNWLANLAEKAADDSSIDVVYGSFEPIRDSFFKECAVIGYLPPPVILEGQLTPPRSIASALMKRRAWESVGGFPEDLRSAEDLVFMQNLERQGFNEVRAPRAVVYWSIQPNLWRTFKRFVTYARNNISAGLWRQWQAAIFQRYALLALVALPAFLVGVKWLIVPLSLWFLLLVARAANSLFKNRFAYPASGRRHLLRLCMLLPIIVVLDMAAFIGSINWLVLDKLRWSRSTT